MQKIALSALALFSSITYAEQLTTFAGIADAVAQGKEITLVMDLQECTSDKFPASPIVGSVKPNAFMVINNNRITASDRHFTLDNPTANGNPTFEYIKYNINSDGKVSIKNTIMNAINYQKIDTFQLACELNKGFKAFG
ncbi:VirK protein [Legionella sainthelensi]|uniref:VirK protein n=1 Tax=Legionella sainthelensi TaxID=28087 RepID=A0A2H5FLD5_9GAMM|nr:VirK family protein [Legionella sainthelensi]AUH72351.1 VirK protein [Legionella sainthelensi]VEB34842.1 VirK protein [Legionella sainthelensi]